MCADRTNSTGTWSTAISRRLGVDVRALATLRISIGLLLLADLTMRARDLEVFYTDAGVLPRAVHAEAFPLLASLSIHAKFGSFQSQAMLFALAAAFALALLVGYRTRVAAVGSWVLLASLYARNPSIVSGGDTILVLTLCFALCLPLGERWSVDALRSDRARTSGRVVTTASAALLSLVVLVYTSNALLRLQSDRWRAGEGVQVVFALDQYTVLLGPALAGIDPVLVAINYLWAVLLFGSGLLLALTGWWRTLAVIPYVGAHLGMLVTLRIGLFPLVMVAVLLPFLPSPFWDAVERRAVEPVRRRLAPRVRAPALLSRLAHWRSSVPVNRPSGRVVSGRGALGRWVRALASGLVVVVLVAAVTWQAALVADVEFRVGDDGGLDPTENAWAMFAPNPPETDGWYVMPAELESGERVDALQGEAVSWDRPPNLADTYPSVAWHAYLFDLRYGTDAEYERLGRYLCTVTADRFDEPVVELEIYYVEEPVVLGGPSESTPRKQYALECPS